MSEMLRAGKRKLFLFTRLLQNKLGRLSCAFVWHAVSEGVYSRVLSSYRPIIS